MSEQKQYANHVIPNSYQTPNIYIDVIMPLLTDSEWRVLSFAMRHILGWREKIEARKGTISLNMFENGYGPYPGCGLNKGTIIKVLKALDKHGILAKDGSVTKDGQRWLIADNLEQIGIQTLETRLQNKRTKDKKRTKNMLDGLRQKRAQLLSHNTGGVLSHNTASGMSHNTQLNPPLNTPLNPKDSVAQKQSDAVDADIDDGGHDEWQRMEWKPENKITPLYCATPGCGLIDGICYDNEASAQTFCHRCWLARSKGNGAAIDWNSPLTDEERQHGIDAYEQYKADESAMQESDNVQPLTAEQYDMLKDMDDHGVGDNDNFACKDGPRANILALADMGLCKLLPEADEWVATDKGRAVLQEKPLTAEQAAALSGMPNPIGESLMVEEMIHGLKYLGYCILITTRQVGYDAYRWEITPVGRAALEAYQANVSTSQEVDAATRTICGHCGKVISMMRYAVSLPEGYSHRTCWLENKSAADDCSEPERCDSQQTAMPIGDDGSGDGDLIDEPIPTPVETKAKAKKPRKPRKAKKEVHPLYQEMVQAIKAAFDVNDKHADKSDFSRIGKVANNLLERDAKPFMIGRFYSWCEKEFDSKTLNYEILKKWYARWRAEMGDRVPDELPQDVPPETKEVISPPSGKAITHEDCLRATAELAEKMSMSQFDDENYED